MSQEQDPNLQQEPGSGAGTPTNPASGDGGNGHEPGGATPPGGGSQKTPEEIQKELDLYKKRYADSSREAKTLAQKLKEKEATGEQPFTDAQLHSKFQNWDSMTDTEKEIARHNAELERKAMLAQNTAMQVLQEREQESRIEEFIEDNDVIRDHASEFRKFTRQPENKGVPLEVLSQAFQYSIGAKPKHKGSVLEGGSGGDKAPVKPAANSEEDLAARRKADPKSYREDLIAGRIKV